MPYRKTLLVPGEIYHVFNRSVAKQPIFINQKDYQRATEVINFYRYRKPGMQYSHYKNLPKDRRDQFFESLISNNKPQVEIIAFCLMPNHVHFLLKALEENSISTFMRNFQHSCSKYFNTKNGRVGSLFQSMFKAVRIESDEQLIHVSRYIHLNPVSSFLIRVELLESYPWTSFKNYFSKQGFINPELVLSYFKSKEEYKKFVYDQADYQQQLETIKHLALE